MCQSTRLLFATIVFMALLPVTAWGYGLSDYPGDRSYPPYAGPAGGHHFSGSLRLQTGITGDGYHLRAWLDVLHPEDVHVYLQHNHLVLQIDQGDQYGRHNHNARSVSQWQIRFRRQLQLPYDADWSRMVVTRKNGIMEIYIPRSSQNMPINPSLKW
jgi:HSP20 family molecular chaperone IbpA